MSQLSCPAISRDQIAGTAIAGAASFILCNAASLQPADICTFLLTGALSPMITRSYSVVASHHNENLLEQFKKMDPSELGQMDQKAANCFRENVAKAICRLESNADFPQLEKSYNELFRGLQA